MKSRLFNLAAAITLLMFAASAWLWVRSYRIGDACMYVSGDAAVYSVCSARAGVLVMYTSRSHGALSMPRPRWHHLAVPIGAWDDPVPRRYGGFGFNGSYYGNTTVLRLPHWFLAALLAIPSLLYLHRRLLRRVPANHCAQCGYDLRATPDRCPECGLDSLSLRKLFHHRRKCRSYPLSLRERAGVRASTRRRHLVFALTLRPPTAMHRGWRP